MSSPAISIIVPIYNNAEYLPDCLASIECQTLSNIEVLCIDDASTDASAAIVKEFANSDPRFKLVHFNENQGAAAARNYAIKQATGEYLAFMDSDDWYPEETTLEKLYTAAKEHNVTIAGGSFSEYRSSTGEFVTNFSHDAYLDKYFTFSNAGIIKYRAWQGDYGYTRFIFKKDLITSNNIEFPLIARQEDPIFFVNAMLAAEIFYAIPDVVYCCRTEHKNLYMDQNTARDGLAAVCQLIELAAKENLPILLQHQLELVDWFAFDAPIWREHRSWKELRSIVSRQARDSFRLRLERIANSLPERK